MPRITVNVSDDVEDWLEAEADALGVSKARAGGHCIEVMQNSVDHINLHRSAVGDDSDDREDLVELVERLDDRLADVEDTVATSGSRDAADQSSRDAAEAFEEAFESEPTHSTDSRERAHEPASSTTSDEGQAHDDPQSHGKPMTDDLDDQLREWLDGRAPKKSHGKDLVVDVFRELREHETLKTGKLQSRLFDEYADHYSTERTMWNAIERYLQDVPGIEKGDYGEWDYAGDDVAREELDEA